MWNGNHFSVYNSDEKTALKLIKEIGDLSNWLLKRFQDIDKVNHKTISYVSDFIVEGEKVSDCVQTFLNYVSNNSGIGIIDRICELEEQIVIKSNTTLYFEKYAMFVSRHLNTMINIADKSHTEYNGYKNIEIYNGFFHCNGSVNLDPMNCFFIQHAKNVKFYNCTFKDINSYHALDLNGSCDIYIEECTFDGFYKSDIKKEDCEAIQIDLAAPVSGEVGACYDYTPTKNVYIKNCKFLKGNSPLYYTAAIGSHNIRYGIYNTNINIEGCEIEGCSKYAINGWKWKEFYINNNKIYNCNSGIKLDTPHYGALSGQDIVGVYKGMEESGEGEIKNNYIDVTYGEGIFIRGKYAKTVLEGENNSGIIDNVLIEKNVVFGGTNFPSIVLLNTKDSKVINNNINRSSSDGIRVYSSFNNIINGNVVKDVKNYGISVSNATLTGTDSNGQSGNNTITDNKFFKLIKCSIFILQSSTNVVTGNTSKECNINNESAYTCINVSSSSNDNSIISNIFDGITSYKNLIYITNTCKRCVVSLNITNDSNVNLSYFNDSVSGVTVNNI